MKTRARSILVAIVAALGFVVSFFMAVQTQLGQRVEDRVLDSSLYSERSPLLALVTVPNLAIALAVIVLIGALRRAWADTVIAAAAMGLSNVLGQLLKHQILQRPDFSIDAVNTFPSGHTIAFTSIAFALVIVLPHAVRPLVMPVFSAVLGLVSAQLVVFGWHRPSDIVGGALLVLAVTATVSAFRPATGRFARGSATASARKSLSVISLVIAIAGAAAIAIAGVLAVLHLLGPLEDTSWTLTAAAASGVIGGELGSTAIIGWMLSARRTR
ncbi:phosphatase PAP2 family protein [Paramicrobacterium chengjingii]|uniref:Phosphatase PAP2 family protein n=1 Tax=Paramicrobacterium chengjingii TaxID=2769067 RepID=A0ABX6YGV6_9MICO|nr:phosphatase PAP2 family protein [Microbacterium chengjingii]QPZ38017.1 phosphatase PAP2 family protein [Microbacterium chengjingii]